MQASNRRGLADIDFIVLRRRQRDRTSPPPLQPRERQRLITKFLISAEEADWRSKQSVDCRLDVGAHMAWKSPHGGDELVRRNVREMPVDGLAAIFKLQEIRRVERACVASGLACDAQGMSGADNLLLRCLEQGVRDRRRIRPARGLALPVDEQGQGEGVLSVLAEDIPQQLHDESIGVVSSL
jgi:hypothetical protein